MTRDVEARRNAVERPRKNTNTLMQQRAEGREGLVIGEKNFLVTYMDQIVRPRRTAWKKIQNFPQKMLRKNSLLFLDGVYKNSIYVQKIHAHVGVVPFLHYFILLFSDPRVRGCAEKRVVGFDGLSRFNRRIS